MRSMGKDYMGGGALDKDQNGFGEAVLNPAAVAVAQEGDGDGQARVGGVQLSQAIEQVAMIGIAALVVHHLARGDGALVVVGDVVVGLVEEKTEAVAQEPAGEAFAGAGQAEEDEEHGRGLYGRARVFSFLLDLSGLPYWPPSPAPSPVEKSHRGRGEN